MVGRNDSGDPIIFAGFITKMDRILHADPVTGLLNRFAFDQAVKEGVTSALAKGEMGAIMIVGLDNFHLLNEAYEKHFDDVALRQIGQSIRNVLPTHLNLYKLDGNEFGLIWPHTSQEEVEIIFSSIQLCLREAKESNYNVFFSASAGAVFYPDSGTDALALQKHAKAALEMAQQQGREQLLVFSQKEYKDWLRFINLQHAFEESIEKGCQGFRLFFQPQVDAMTQELVGAEALLRWQEEDGLVISPVVFIPILERTRLIIPVGRWIVDEAVRVCKKWQEFKPGFQMSINVSLCQLETTDLRNYVKESLERHALSPECLTLELTESQQISNWQFVNEQFDFFRQMIFEYHPVGMISVERCGLNAENDYANMRGISISEHNAPTDILFQIAHEYDIRTVGVGDGGNEIGMGNVADIIKQELSLVPCVVKVDYLVIASVSNWGAYGLAAYLSIMEGKHLMPNYAWAAEYMKETVEIGSVDGITHERVTHVDGFEESVEQEIIDALGAKIDAELAVTAAVV